MQCIFRFLFATYCAAEQLSCPIQDYHLKFPAIFRLKITIFGR